MIGEKSDAADTARICIENGTGMDIVGIEVRTDDMDYQDSLISYSEPVKDGEKAVLYYNTTEAEQAAQANGNTPVYRVRFTFPDDSVVVHDFPFGSLDEVRVCVENTYGSGYLIYKDSTGQDVSTEEIEIHITRRQLGLEDYDEPLPTAAAVPSNASGGDNTADDQEVNTAEDNGGGTGEGGTDQTADTGTDTGNGGTGGTDTGNGGTDTGNDGTDTGNAGTDAGTGGTDTVDGGTDAGNTGTDTVDGGTDAGNTGTDAGTGGTDAGTDAGNGGTDAQADPGETEVVNNGEIVEDPEAVG